MAAIRVYTASGGWQDISLVGPAGPQGVPGPSGPAARVTSLPGSPVDGQECYYVADATNGIVWHLKYNSGSASAYKWEVVGGPPLYSEVLTQEVSNALGYADLATVGPSITVPLAGDYDVFISTTVYCTSVVAAGGQTWMTFAPPTASDVNGVVAQQPGTSGMNLTISRIKRRAALAAATALVAKYKITGSASYVWYHSNRTMSVTPLRVG